jgi:hypothetical protein
MAKLDAALHAIAEGLGDFMLAADYLGIHVR